MFALFFVLSSYEDVVEHPQSFFDFWLFERCNYRRLGVMQVLLTIKVGHTMRNRLLLLGRVGRGKGLNSLEDVHKI